MPVGRLRDSSGGRAVVLYAVVSVVILSIGFAAAIGPALRFSFRAITIARAAGSIRDADIHAYYRVDRGRTLASGRRESSRP